MNSQAVFTIINIISGLFLSTHATTAPVFLSMPARSQVQIAQSTSNAFTPGNVVVCRVGDGIGTLSSNAAPVFLDEYSPAGSLVGSTALPTIVSGTNKQLTLSGNLQSECQLSTSADGRYFAVGGYAANVGALSVSTSQTATVPRVLGRVDMNGVVDTSTTTTSFNSQPIRSVASNSGTAFWATGQASGVIYQTLAGSSGGITVAANPVSNSALGIVGGQLFTAAGGPTAISTVGSGMPTTSGQIVTPLPGMPGSGQPNQFVFADLSPTVAGNDTLYVSDLGAATGSAGGGVKKYSLQNGIWVYNGTFPANPAASIQSTQYFGLAGSVSGGTVTLIATRLSSTGSTQLVKLIDSAGFGLMPIDQPTLLATAGTNKAFRGVAIAPAPVIPGSLQLSANSYSGTENSTSIPITITRSNGSLGAVAVSYSLGGGTATGGSTCSGGVDYINTGGVVNFASGETAPKAINIPVCNDAVYEGDETFVVTLTTPTGGATLGTPASAVVTIAEDDPHQITFTVNLAGDGGDGTCDVTCTLRDAITAANNNPGDDTVVFVPGLAKITLASEIIISGETPNGSLTINGPGASLLIIDGGPGSNRIFSVTGNVTISDLTLTGGDGIGSKAPGSGAAILMTSGDLVLNRMNVTANGGLEAAVANRAVGGSGSIQSSTLTINSSSVSNNSSGGIYNLAATQGNAVVYINSCDIKNNTGGGVKSESTGGAISAAISGSTISGNQGSGITSAGNSTAQMGVLSITDSRVANNTSGSGGGIRNIYGTVTISRSSVVGNIANDPSGSGGGGLLIQESYLTVDSSTISGNSTAATGTSAGGGGIMFFGHYANYTASIRNSTISGNSSANYGGGVFSQGFNGGGHITKMTIAHTTLAYNSAPNGGAIYNQGPIFDGGADIYLSHSILKSGDTGTDLHQAMGSIFSQGFNLSNGDGGGKLAGSGDIINTDPRLGPLQNNGGPTLTHALLAGSPAVDAGNPNAASPPQFDQRGTGFPRVVDGNNNGVAIIDIGAFEAPSPIQTPHAAAKFDFDGDGRTDETVFRPTTGVWYLNRSQLGFTGYQFGATGDLIAPADFTGDGKTDSAVFRPSTGTWYILRSEDNTFYAPQFGASGDIPAPGDYDGDGKADTAVFRPSNGTWFIQRSSAGFTASQFGANGDVPTVGDFDGDGKSDVAVFRPSSGVWYRLNSGNGSFFGTQFGQNGDKVVAADYTGDGKTDLAIWRPSNGTWYIQRSEDNSFYGQQFGLTSDLPSPGDYDGDGKADTAVFRPSNGTWFEQRSTAGFAAVAFGSNGDKPAPNAFAY